MMWFISIYSLIGFVVGIYCIERLVSFINEMKSGNANKFEYREVLVVSLGAYLLTPASLLMMIFGLLGIFAQYLR